MRLFGKKKSVKKLIDEKAEALMDLIKNSEKADAIVLTVTTDGNNKIVSYDNGIVKGSPETLVEMLHAAAEDDDELGKIIMTVASILKSKNPELRELDKKFDEAENFLNKNKHEVMKINPKNDEEVEDIIAKFLKEKGLSPDEVEIRKIRIPKSGKKELNLDDITDDMTDKQIEDLLDKAGGISFGSDDDIDED